MGKGGAARKGLIPPAHDLWGLGRRRPGGQLAGQVTRQCGFLPRPPKVRCAAHLLGGEQPDEIGERSRAHPGYRLFAHAGQRRIIPCPSRRGGKPHQRSQLAVDSCPSLGTVFIA